MYRVIKSLCAPDDCNHQVHRDFLINLYNMIKLNNELEGM
jgi:hypothetical protein